jgi:hypothetical protein
MARGSEREPVSKFTLQFLKQPANEPFAGRDLSGGGCRAAMVPRLMHAAFGDEVINHFVHADNWEQFEYDRHITDWERTRLFERG